MASNVEFRSDGTPVTKKRQCDYTTKSGLPVDIIAHNVRTGADSEPCDIGLVHDDHNDFVVYYRGRVAVAPIGYRLDLVDAGEAYIETYVIQRIDDGNLYLIRSDDVGDKLASGKYEAVLRITHRDGKIVGVAVE